LINNLRILFITLTHSGGGGAETVLTNLVNHLPKTWCIDILETTDYAIKKEAINANIRLLPPLTKNSYKGIDHLIRYVFFYHPKVIKTLRHLYDYDVVVGWIYQNATFMLPAFGECKKIAWFHGMVDDLLPTSSSTAIDYYQKFKIFRLQKKACAHSDKIVVISNKTKKSLLRVYPENSNKMEIIYNPVDIKKIIKLSNEAMDEAELAFLDKLNTTTYPILASIGRLDENKNFSLALKAIAILKQKNIFVNYLIIGTADIKELEKLEKLRDALNLKDRVFFMGFRQNPLRLLKTCKLLLVTSLEEGFSMVAAEAMALGIPFVTTPVAGASEELSNNETCGLVADWNEEEYADKIELLLKDKALYAKMSDACKEHIKNFSIESSFQSFYKMLEAIPKKNIKERKKNRVWAFLLFIIYTIYGYIKKTTRQVRVRLNIFKNELSLLNMFNLLFAFNIFFVSLLSLPLFAIYSGLLAIKNKKKLLGYK